MAGARSVGRGAATGQSTGRRDAHRESLGAPSTGPQPGGRPGSNGGTAARGGRAGRPTAATDQTQHGSPATPVGHQAPTIGDQAGPAAVARSDLGRNDQV